MDPVLQLYTPMSFLVIHLFFKKTTEKIEVWLIIVYYNIVLVLFTNMFECEKY